jgi:hypothetical protein
MDSRFDEAADAGTSEENFMRKNEALRARVDTSMRKSGMRKCTDCMKSEKEFRKTDDILAPTLGV